MKSLASLILLLCLAVPVASADRGVVALIPAHTFKGDAANGGVVTDALRKNLEGQRYRVVSATETEAALRRLNIDTTRRVFLPALTALGRELKVRYVIYPTVQGVGVGINQQVPDEYQATILVNVADPEKNHIAYLYQIGQLFQDPDRELERAVIPKPAAAQAAQRLLEGFYRKAHQ